LGSRASVGRGALMPMIKTHSRSFAGGEVTPEFWGRIDDLKYQTGLSTCRNFLVLPHGPVANRPGTEFVREVKHSDKFTRIIPFSFSTTQTMVLEVGDLYVRFHTQGATLLSGGSPYEVVTPYLEDDLSELRYVQSADVLTIVHPKYAPRELRRLGPTNWVLQIINFNPTISPPPAPTVIATRADSPTNLRSYLYKITSMGDGGLEESLGSAAGTTNQTNNLLQTGAFNTITWAAVAGAGRYRIYREDNGLFGYVGETDALTFKDEGVTADLSVTPPNIKPTFDGVGNYPAAVSYYQQRRVFGGTTNQPQNVWMTRSGTESNITYSLPSRDDDSLGFKVAARESNTIRHIVPLQDLVLLTSSAEWRLDGSDGPLTPSNIKVGPQSYIGVNSVQPLVVNNSLIYAASRGGHVREMGYSQNAGGYITGDLSLRATHLFDTLRIVDMAYAKAPIPFCWMVSSGGKLLGFTYIPEQQIGAWHQHDTINGEFESIAVVAEGEEDALYCVVNRQINGQQVRYVERLHTRSFVGQEDAFFVDCGLTYNGAPADNITGLNHLEGQEVAILIDGAVHPRRTVSGGSIQLDVEGSVVHIGLPITADIQTLPLAFETGGMGQGRVKNVNKVWLRVYRSSGIFTGPSFDRLTEAKQRTTENWGMPPALKTEEIEVMVEGDWTDSGGIYVRQADPLPLTVLSMVLEVSIGG
jgi:hypothetical protein